MTGNNTISNSFRGEHTGEMVSQGDNGSGPILLAGLPRSGTTWIGKIFDSHPSTLYLHEPDSAVPMKEIPLLVDSASSGPEAVELRAVLERTMSVRLTRVAAALPRFPKAYRTPAFDWLHRRIAVGAKIWSRLFEEINLPDMLVGSPQRSVRLVWKSIESVGRIGLIARLIPNFRIIHILRHPCGWMASVSRGEHERRFSSKRDDWWLFGLLADTQPAKRRNLTMESFQAMNDLERDAWLWVLWNENGAESCGDLANVMIIRYEDVCANPIQLSQQMFDFAGLDWNAQTEEFVQHSVSIDRKDYYSVFRDPLVAANKWRQNFSVEDVSIVESILQGSNIGRIYLEPSRGTENKVINL